MGLQTIEVGFKPTSDNPPSERPQALGSRKELEQFLGPPARSVNLNPAEKVEVYLYPDKGTKLITYGLRGTIIGIIAESELATSTPEGIGVGHPKEKLIATYGEPQKVTEMGGLLYYLYSNDGLLFSLQGEKVKSWMVWLGTK